MAKLATVRNEASQMISEARAISSGPNTTPLLWSSRVSKGVYHMLAWLILSVSPSSSLAARCLILPVFISLHFTLSILFL